MDKLISIFHRAPKSVRDTLLYSLSAALIGALSFILLPLLSRSMGEGGYGVFSIIASFTTISSSFFFLGMTSAVQRFYFKFETQHQRESVYNQGLAITFIGSVLQVVVVFSLLNPIAALLFPHDHHGTAILLGTAYSSAQLIIAYISMSYRINRNPLGALIFSLSLLFISIFSLLILNSYGGLGRVELVYATLLIASTVHILIFSKSLVNRSFFCFTPIITGNGLIKYGLISVFASFAAQIFLSSDIIVAHRLMNPDSVGQLAAVMRVASIYTILFVSPVNQVFPYLIYREGSRSVAIKTLNTALIAFLSLSLFVVTLLSVCFYVLLPYLTSFAFSSHLLLVVYISLLVVLFNGIVGFSSIGLTFGLRPDLLAWSYLSASIIKFFLFFAFPWTSSLQGFLILSAIASLFLNILLFLLSSHFLNYNLFLGQASYFAFQAFIAGLGFYLFSLHLAFGPARLVGSLLVFASLISVYFSPSLRHSISYVFPVKP